MNHEFDVFGIGSPLIDIFMEAEDHHLVELELKKGEMHLIDQAKLEELQKKLKKPPIKTSVAGDIVNTVMGVASMGGRAVFCGKVGKDGYADMFEEVLASDNIKPVLSRCKYSYTGRVISFVTKDAQRTMTTHLGAAVGLKKEEAVLEDLKKSKFLYTSAYVLDSTDLKDSVLEALRIAKSNKVRIAFDLADRGVISRHRENMKMLIQDYADIIFANELEAEAFTGKKPGEAIHELSKMCKIAVVKLGENGSLIKSGNDIIEVTIKKEKAIDSTGAGDMYAAGFLYALSKTDDLGIAGEVASFASAKVVQQYGAKLEAPIIKEVERIIEGKKQPKTETF